MDVRRVDNGLDSALAAAKGVEQHGNSLRITFHYQRRRCREVLNIPITKANIKYAARLREAIQHEITMGTFDYGKHFPESAGAARFSNGDQVRPITLGELADRFLTVKESDISSVSIRAYRNGIARITKSIGPQRMVNTLRQEDILLWRKHLIHEPSSKTGRLLEPRSINTYIATMVSLIQFAHQNRYIATDLSGVLDRVRVDREKPDPFSEDEQLRLEAAAHSEMDKLWIRLGCWTGLRSGELAALAWEDIDLERGELTVRRSVTNTRIYKLTKTNKERTILLLPPALAALKTLRSMTILFPTTTIKKRNGPGRFVDETCRFVLSPAASSRYCKAPGFTPENLAGRWRTLIRQSGIRNRSQYHMRHTFASRMLTAGANPEWVATYLGHADSQMVRTVYGAWMPEQDKSEVSKVWDGLQQLFPESAPKMPQKIC